MPKGTPLGDISNGKVCPKCSTHKELSEFHRDKNRPGGYSGTCKVCSAAHAKFRKARDPEYVARKGREWRAKNPERAKDLLLRYNYGVEIGTYGEMLVAQNGVCAICGTNDPGLPRYTRFHVDHCHDSKKIRGLLCSNCNIGIGNLMHSEVILRSAIDYLIRTKS